MKIWVVTSSNLFEIENLSGSENPMFTRQESDGMSSCMTSTTKYEPSETSIDRVLSQLVQLDSQLIQALMKINQRKVIAFMVWLKPNPYLTRRFQKAVRVDYWDVIVIKL